jgi:hypothetical protein
MNWLKFGTQYSKEDKLWDHLSRKAEIDVLAAMLQVVSSPQNLDVESAAIICDTNVLLRLPKHSRHDEVLDYLSSIHRGPLSLPGQVFQELWNNHISVAETSREKIKTKFRQFREEVMREQDYPTSVSKMDSLLNQIIDEHSPIFVDGWVEKLKADLLTLQPIACVKFVDRQRFAGLAAIRKQTKTPPGFKDDSYGDFFVWADGLLGVLEHARSNQPLNALIMLTGDKKSDWMSKGGKPHPILVAEVASLLGASLRLCDIDEFASMIETAS